MMAFPDIGEGLDGVKVLFETLYVHCLEFMAVTPAGDKNCSEPIFYSGETGSLREKVTEDQPQLGVAGTRRGPSLPSLSPAGADLKPSP